MTETPKSGMGAPHVQIIGMAWFNESDYAGILDIMEDAANLPKTYEAWEKIARKRESELKGDGHVVVRAIIHPKAFAGWCAVRGLHIDANARTTFANDYAASQVR